MTVADGGAARAGLRIRERLGDGELPRTWLLEQARGAIGTLSTAVAKFDAESAK